MTPRYDRRGVGATDPVSRFKSACRTSGSVSAVPHACIGGLIATVTLPLATFAVPQGLANW